ncbi:MAG: sulfotransferase family 2 domain-containing protein [Acetobacteraceae bacterium]|nr:sulfotransferase family 2 domain-containing protein [Acetobacteraceae bacterium]
MRTVIFHHHLFKNAGTSVDAALRRAYGDRWTPLEADGGELDAGRLVRLLQSRPNLVAVSSHTYRLPLPNVTGIRFIPIVFLRHPLDRVRSAYEFERRQEADTEGARMAKQLDFAGYVAARLTRPGDRSIRNFQTMKLSTIRSPQDGSPVDEFLSALDTFCTLPFVGLVENFEHSIHVYEQLISAALEPVELPIFAENVGRSATHTLGERVTAAQDMLGPDLSRRFAAENEFDERLYQLARRAHYRG